MKSDWEVEEYPLWVYQPVPIATRRENRRKMVGWLLALAISVGMWFCLYKAVTLLGDGW